MQTYRIMLNITSYYESVDHFLFRWRVCDVLIDEIGQCWATFGNDRVGNYKRTILVNTLQTEIQQCQLYTYLKMFRYFSIRNVEFVTHGYNFASMSWVTKTISNSNYKCVQFFGGKRRTDEIDTTLYSLPHKYSVTNQPLRFMTAKQRNCIYRFKMTLNWHFRIHI